MTGRPSGVKPHRIRLRLRRAEQLFNSMDPSPFHEKDLDGDAEAFLVGWVREIPLRDPVRLVVELEQGGDDPGAQRMIRSAVRHYFAQRARVTRGEFAELMRQGQVTLVIGSLFLLACFLAGELLGRLGTGPLIGFGRESLIIAGWVAMWRPMQIYLYDWWPLRRAERVFEKMRRMPVRVRARGPAAPAAPAAPASEFSAGSATRTRPDSGP
jgi:hypothetical protein